MPRRKSEAVDEAIAYAKKSMPTPRISAPRENAPDSESLSGFKGRVREYKVPAPQINVILKKLGADDGGLICYLDSLLVGAVSMIREEYLNLDEDDIKKKLFDDFGYVPSTTIETIRTRFWEEFDRVQIAREPKMISENFYKGVCAKDYFQQLMTDPLRWPAVAYIITRPVEYEQTMRALLTLATSRLKDILSIPILNKHGEPRDPKMIDTILKAAAMVDMRAKGQYIQRTENKTMQITHTTHASVLDIKSKPVDQLNMDEIKERLALLEEEEKKLALGIMPSFMNQRNVVDAVVVESHTVSHPSDRPSPMDGNLPKQGKTVDKEFEV